MKLIIGDGLLGKELIKQTGWQYISRKKDGIDINDILSVLKLIPDNCTHLINCAANTDTYSDNREAMMQANYAAVKQLIELCKDKNIKYVHYSTDYVYAGSVENASEIDEAIADKTWYAQSKLLADYWIQTNYENHLIVRGSHRISPFPYPKALSNQVGNFDDVEILVDQWKKLIEAGETGLWNIGTPTKSVYEYAKRIREDVEAAEAPAHFPLNTTMNLDKLNHFLEKIKQK